jgi:hypothetical protein
MAPRPGSGGIKPGRPGMAGVGGEPAEAADGCSNPPSASRLSSAALNPGTLAATDGGRVADTNAEAKSSAIMILDDAIFYDYDGRTGSRRFTNKDDGNGALYLVDLCG